MENPMNTPMQTPLKTATQSTHPLILVAAASVTLLSFAGIASIAGWLPGTRADTLTPVAQVAQVPAPQQITPPQATPAVAPVSTEKAAPLSVTVKPAEQQAPRRAATAQRVAMPSAAPAPSYTPSTSATATKPPPIAESSPAYSNREAAQTSTPPVSDVNDSGIYAENSRLKQSPCSDCGTIESIREIAQEGKGSGLGAIAGTLLGGILGHQVGNGTGRDIATVVGALGGAFAGNEVEKNARGSHQYQITVRLDDGSMRTITETAQPKWQNGERVRVNNNRIASL